MAISLSDNDLPEGLPSSHIRACLIVAYIGNSAISPVLIDTESQHLSFVDPSCFRHRSELPTIFRFQLRRITSTLTPNELS